MWTDSVDPRPVLEAVAFGDDPKIKPADRLRALELLEEGQRSRTTFDSDLAGLSTDELDRELDGLIGDVIARAVIEGTGWPVLSAALESHLELRMRQIGEAHAKH